MKLENMGWGMMGYDESNPNTINQLQEVIEQLNKKADELKEKQKVYDEERRLRLAEQYRANEIEKRIQAVNESFSTRHLRLNEAFMNKTEPLWTMSDSLNRKLEKRVKRDKNTVYVVLKHARKSRKGNLMDARIYGVYQNKYQAWDKEQEVRSSNHLPGDAVTTLQFHLKKGE